MPRWLVCALAVGCAWPTMVVLRSRGDLALAGPSAAAQVLVVGAGLLLVVAAAASRGESAVRLRLLAAGVAAWLAAEWASPAAPGALAFTAGLAATGLALPLVLAGALPVARSSAIAAAAGALVLGPLSAMAVDPRDVGCFGCPARSARRRRERRARGLAVAPRRLAVASGLCRRRRAPYPRRAARHAHRPPRRPAGRGPRDRLRLRHRGGIVDAAARRDRRARRAHRASRRRRRARGDRHGQSSQAAAAALRAARGAR
jgi:hypothetical protein